MNQAMHQATRVRFRGGDPLALTKRIEARRRHCPCGQYHDRPTYERETPADFGRAFLTFALLIVGLYALVLVAGAYAVATL